ncbi:putative DNA binding domain-containing protein [candidate division KSB1 bacterium]|nr:putative DNA binding domain-containing protein [candidate division KSB1 bacterium]
MALIPSREDILRLLDELDKGKIADDLKSEVVDFKPWLADIEDNQAVAVESVVCFANSAGGIIVFGVKDHTQGRRAAITGCTGYDLDVWRRAIYDATRPHITVDIEELNALEGRLLLVRVPKGAKPPYGTAGGIYKMRVGKNCMPLDLDAFDRRQVATGAIDWSAEPIAGLSREAFDAVEIARLRNVLRTLRPKSDLLSLSDDDLLSAIGALRDGQITRAGLLLLGRRDVLARMLPQHEVIYLYAPTSTKIGFRKDLKAPLLYVLERLAELIQHPERNPVQTLRVGLFHISIPVYPEETFREAILNALIHRDYLEQGAVHVHHRPKEMVVSNPGGFIGGITPENILHHEPQARNRLLAEMFLKIGLVERAGSGRRRIFIPTLSYGKRPPQYQADAHTVTLTLFNEGFDAALAGFIAKRQREGKEFDMDDLLLLSYLRHHSEIDVPTAAQICQRPYEAMRDLLEGLALQPEAWLEQRGKKKGVAYYLSPSAVSQLLSKAARTRTRDINAVRYPELIRAYVEQHGSIKNEECRELLGLGNSPTARVKASRLLSRNEFLARVGESRAIRYRLRNKVK